MIKIKSLTMKNFLSTGNVSQSISFTDNELFLLMGENLDQGGLDSKNGVGKSAIGNGLSYALFGKPLVWIKTDNLINRTNGKQLHVTIEFEKDKKNYRIERGRKPNLFKFYIDNKETNDSVESEGQGEGRLTQVEIEKILGMSHLMFSHLVGLNTYTEPFLSMGANDQRTIIEQLLGITKLSEKAELLKVAIKENKDLSTREEFRIVAIKEVNKKIEENITSTERRSALWEKVHLENVTKINDELTKLQSLDIEEELSNHEFNAANEHNKDNIRVLSAEIKNKTRMLSSFIAQKADLDNKLKIIEDKKCHACGQAIDECEHERLREEIVAQSESITAKIQEEQEALSELEVGLQSIPNSVNKKTLYSSVKDAYEHKSKLETLAAQLVREEQLTNPYTDSIESLRNEGLQEIKYDEMNRLIRLMDHQEFLLKLLTNKDSFIRKKIIKQNLALLNRRLDSYLVRLGLPHKVEFLSDLTVEITEHGRDLDFNNLSRGERTRLILSLSFAFRDIFENLNEKINLLYVDEILDNGLDAAGVEASLKVLKKMTRDDGRCVHLISHREELVNRVDNVIRIIKENGFTTIESGG